MISYKNIRTISRYERKILLRSWFFRIFAILSLFIIGMFGGTTLLGHNPFTWAFRSMPAGLIYSNMFLLNIFQSVIAVFLATDFLKRDKKLNTSEVLFVRPMTNFEYITGKTFGLLSVFILLNLLVILLTFIYQLISTDVAFDIISVLLYFLLVSIPTLFFIIGLSFALMSVIQNQPVTFILLLGYIALILFYLGEKTGYIFDYMTFVMPLPHSDIVGFSNWNYLLLHRLSYFILGCAFILFTIWHLNRLPNQNSSRWWIGVLSVLLLVVSLSGFYKMYNRNREVIQKRKNIAELSSTSFDKAVPDMKKASIRVEYGDKMKAQSTMKLKNNSGQEIDTLLFSINPGFKVEKVFNATGSFDFIQNKLLVNVVPQHSMKPGDELELTMTYSGIPDFDIAYLDNDDEDFFGYDRVITLRVNREYGFYNNNYVLLTKECLWYPIPGIAYDPSRPAIFRQQFTHFDLKVVSQPGMLPVAQGERTTTDSLTYHFHIRDKLPQLSLSIANYQEKSIKIQGIDVHLYYFKGHDYFARDLSELNDTLSAVILEFLNDYERPLGLYYPYPTFSLVEAPVQFASLSHSWTSTRAQSQPQIIYYPEHGYNIRQADFTSNVKRVKRDSERNKQGLSNKEIQATVFLNFLNNVFAEEDADNGFSPGSNSSGSNPYCIFPNYYYYVNYITSSECPVLNYAFESYLMAGEDDVRSMFMSRMQGLSDNEKANLLLQEKSLKQIIATVDDKQAVNRVLSAKGSYLLTWMEKQVNDTDFKTFLLDYLYKNSYREIKYNELIKSLSGKFNIELGNFLSDWYNANKLPAFALGPFYSVETIDGLQSVYVLKTKITNYADVAGMVKFTFELESGSGGGGPGSFMGGGSNQQETEERIYIIGANQTKEMQIVLNSSPRAVIFNTLLSQNIPASTMTFGLRPEKDETIKAVEYEKTVDSPVTYIENDELVVDNLDKGFYCHDPAMDNPVRQFIEKRKKEEETKYVGVGFGPAPSTWSLSASSDYFGKVEHSAMVVRSGNGNKTATWKVAIPEAGYYDIYVYLNRQRGFGRSPGRGGGRGPGGGPGRGRREPEGKYVYTIMHDDGVEDVELELKDFEDGWNLLGSFYISTDSASVTLSDKGGASRVVADAAKWVLQQ